MGGEPGQAQLVWEAFIQSHVSFKAVPEKGPEKVWKALVQSQVRLKRVPPQPSQVKRGSGKGFGEGSRSLGTRSSQVQPGSEKLQRKAKWGSTDSGEVAKQVPEALMQSQVRFY